MTQLIFCCFSALQVDGTPHFVPPQGHIYSTDGTLDVKFETDRALSGPGFTAIYSVGMYFYLALCLPVSSADNLGKQFGPRSGNRRA